MNNTELLPCPFCGGHARPMKCKVGIEGTMGCNKWVTITCSMCEINNGGKGGFMRPRYDTEEEAAKAWNTRADKAVPEGWKILEKIEALIRQKKGFYSISVGHDEVKRAHKAGILKGLDVVHEEVKKTMLSAAPQPPTKGD